MPGKKHINGPPSVNRYYEECLKSKTAQRQSNPKEYCARVAWNRYCSYKNPDYPGCTEKGRDWIEHRFSEELARLRQLSENEDPNERSETEADLFYSTEIAKTRDLVVKALKAAGCHVVENPKDPREFGLSVIAYGGRFADIVEALKMLGATTRPSSPMEVGLVLDIGNTYVRLVPEKWATKIWIGPRG